jgi:SAM-dependent methyltransferase
VGPDDLRVREQHAFVSAALEHRKRVLEVGCGAGQLARRLAADGCTVTALDRELRDRSGSVTFVERDFLAFDAAPFEAVVFTASLHHISPLGDAAAHARKLVAPGGVVIADEFDIASPDRETLRWYYETQELLAAAGVYDATRIDAPDVADPVARWQAGHEPHLHTGQEMRQALAALGTFSAAPAPYLYRYICGGLPATDAGGSIAAHVLATEQARIREGSLVAVGVRITVMVG